MTERLYYTDAGLRLFEARVVSSAAANGRTEVVLDRTAFYPTSGGQPFDTGRLGPASVVDVRDEDDGRVVHVVDAPLEAGAAVRGEIDWPRRFDHMQQHTGQHLLSAAFDRLFGAGTVSFHLGAEVSTIDLAREVTPREVTGAEDETNRVVWDDTPVTVRFVTEDEARALPLRKAPARGGTLRLVEVADFDLSACGGTHVPRTGVVGLVAVTGTERFKGGTRVSFVCGRRALDAHRRLAAIVGAATRTLSVTPAEIPAAIERQQQDARVGQRALRGLQDALARYRAAELRTTAETIGAHRAIVRVEADLDAPALKALASGIVRGEPLIAVLAGAAVPTPVVVAAGPGAAIDAAVLMRRLAADLGGRGGGSPTLAQGGIAQPAVRVVEIVRAALLEM